MYLAVDIGGTKTLLARMNKSGEIEDSIKFPTPRDYKDFKITLEENIAKITTGKWKHACVAAPGKVDREAGVGLVFGNLPWKNAPIVKDVKSVADCPVIIENDVKLAGLSEARLMDPPVDKVCYVTVSTGISNGVVVDQKIDPTLQDSEVGNMLFERDGQLVTWESFASGKAIVRRFGKLASEIDDPEIWKIISRDIALGLIDISANIQPDVIVIGGGVGSHFKKYGKFLREELKKYDSPMVKVPTVIPAVNPEEAVIYGCYELIKDHEKSSK